MSKQIAFKSYDILGIGVDALTNAEAINYITERAKHSRSGYVVKPYVEFFDQIKPSIGQLLNQADLCLPDGVSVQWAAWYLYGGRHNIWRLLGTLSAIISSPKLLTTVLPSRTAGPGFTWSLLEASARASLKIYLIGHPAGSTIEHTARHVMAGIDGLQVVGWFDGYAVADQIEAAAAAIEQLQPDLILVGVGFPLQEQLMANLTGRLSHGLFIGEGGTFDFSQFGGHKRRAPMWMRQVGLEWLWRLKLEPQRLRRQLAIPRFIWRIYRQGKALNARPSN